MRAEEVPVAPVQCCELSGAISSVRSWDPECATQARGPRRWESESPRYGRARAFAIVRGLARGVSSPVPDGSREPFGVRSERRGPST
jgi:hypothetical protein